MMPPLIIILFGLLCSSTGRVQSQTLPAPIISLIPSWGISEGQTAIIYCKSPFYWRVDFYLKKDGHKEVPFSEVNRGVAMFPVTNASREAGGTYSCYYSTSWLNWTRSPHSESVELLIRDPALSRPTISLTPNQPIASLGSSITIACLAKVLVKTFHLVMDDHDKIPPLTLKPDGNVTTFTIHHVGQEHGGRYYCSYRPQARSFTSSEPSNTVELLVLDPSLSKPTISLSSSEGPAFGGTAAIHCQSPVQAQRFYLHMSGNQMPYKFTEAHGTKASFPISSLKNGGNYSCSYCPESEPFVISEPSDPVEVLKTDLDLPRPSISFYPSTIAILGSRVTIQCQASGPRKIFYFEKAGNQRVQQFETVGDSGTLFFQNVTRDHGGKYSCSYRYPPESIISRTSDNVELLVRDPSFSRPTISLSSSGRPARGRTVILHCQSQSPANRFYLHKSEDHMAEMFIETNGTEASFPISIGNWGHGGNYSCSYCPELESFVISEPSDSVELLITDPTLLRPSISLEPRGIALLGSTVTIWCQTRSRRKIFYLEKAGGQRIQQYESLGDRGRFVFRNVTQEQTGYYSCSYRYLALFFIISGTSDNVELLGLDPKLPRPVISINHSGLVAAGEQVNIRCKIQDGSAKFYLHKGGDSKTKEPMRSDANVGEVSISNINQKHQGSYSCSYTFLERPFVFSLHSDSVELRIAGKSSGISSAQKQIQKRQGNDAEDTQNSVPLSTKLCVAVLILFLSLGAILWYKRNKGQLAAAKSSAKRSFRLLKACWVTDPDRNLIDGGNHMENLSPEPDPPAETQYICYFELEHRAVSSPVEADPADSSENCV